MNKSLRAVTAARFPRKMAGHFHCSAMLAPLLPMAPLHSLGPKVALR